MAATTGAGGATVMGGATSAGAPATGAGGGVVATNSALGTPCLKDADCGAGLTCLTPMGNEFDGGGVPNGLCSLDCSADIGQTNPTKCAPLGANAICLQITDTTAYCVESCAVGPRTPTKCHSRHDMACTDPMNLGVGYCQPTCRGDFDCSGRTCDLGSGVCTGPIGAERKLPIGAKCDPNATTDICSGACVGLVEGTGTMTTVGFCSGICRLGEAGCGVNPSTAGKRDAYCLLPTDPNAAFADLGFCSELCDCNKDCSNPDFVCSPVQGLVQEAGRTGACGPPDKSGDASMGIACRDR